MEWYIQNPWSCLACFRNLTVIRTCVGTNRRTEFQYFLLLFKTSESWLPVGLVLGLLFFTVHSLFLGIHLSQGFKLILSLTLFKYRSPSQISLLSSSLKYSPAYLASPFGCYTGIWSLKHQKWNVWLPFKKKKIVVPLDSNTKSRRHFLASLFPCSHIHVMLYLQFNCFSRSPLSPT